MSRRQRGKSFISTKIDSTSLALSKVTAAGAEDGQLVLTLANGKTINYSQIKALV